VSTRHLQFCNSDCSECRMQLHCDDWVEWKGKCVCGGSSSLGTLRQFNKSLFFVPMSSYSDTCCLPVCLLLAYFPKQVCAISVLYCLCVCVCVCDSDTHSGGRKIDSFVINFWTSKLIFNWFPMTPSIATKFQYVNSPFFIFFLTHYMFRPLRAIFRWDIRVDVSKLCCDWWRHREPVG
jgi:hypothetical protein